MRKAARPRPVLAWWVRGTLLALGAALTAVFAVALWLRPYDEFGRPALMGTHQQMGLPPCVFYTLTGLPCPSCGMTTSFALLMHGDPGNSLRANAAGTLLAVCWLLTIPWSVVCAVKGRLLLIRSLEMAFGRAIVVFVLVVLVRWVVVVGWEALARR
jgi:hypothetical protein